MYRTFGNRYKVMGGNWRKDKQWWEDDKDPDPYWSFRLSFFVGECSHGTAHKISLGFCDWDFTVVRSREKWSKP